MCGCEAHWKSNVYCTCRCPEHESVRLYAERLSQLNKTMATNTGNTTAAGVARTVLYDVPPERVYELGDYRPNTVLQGSNLRISLLDEVEPEAGPTEDEIEQAIESIKRAASDD